MDISTIVKAQRSYYASGVTRPLRFRREMLCKLRSAIRKNEDRIAAALMEDLHKSSAESYMCETGILLDEIRYHLRHLRSWMRVRHAPGSAAQFPGSCILSPEPYGVTLIMAPWNYPVLLCLEPLVGAISAGNCAVIKPSAYAPKSSRVVASIINDTFPAEYITVVEGGRVENSALLRERFDYIFFTGGTKVGSLVMEQAAKNLTPVTLELGGKSPVIVDEKANLKLAAKRIAFGKIVNAGQTCVAPDYLLIHESVLDTFLTEFRAALESFFPGGNYEQMTHIINEKHFQRLSELMKLGTIILGGETDPETRFIAPTLITNLPPAAPILQQEIFGPILPVIPYRSLSECIRFINERPKPLALYLFTEDRDVRSTVLSRCSFGGGCINDVIMHVASSKTPFGGVGASGMGAYHGKASFDTFTHTRTILRQGRFDLPMRYPPYSRTLERLVHYVLK